MLLLLACGGEVTADPKDSPAGTDPTDGTGSGSTESAETAETAETADSGTGPTDSPADSEDSAPIDSDTTEPPEPIVRFVAMGDGGEGNDEQKANAVSIGEVCAAKTDTRAGCDFVLYLGDNFYDEGVDSVDDEQFETKFESVYGDLGLTFNVVLGNHDYGGCLFDSCGGGWEFDKGQYEIDYTSRSAIWNMPDAYYSFTAEHAEFFGLDTNAIMWDPWLGTAGDQPDWFSDAVAASTADWKIAFGHHPYISNGQHGNAGSYEGLDWLEDLSLADVPLGAAVQDFMEDRLCGNVDLYVCGHDHNRQWLESACGTEFVVSGAASKTTDLQDRGNPTWYEDDSEVGFVWIELRGDVLTGEFYDIDGNLDYTTTFSR